MSIDIVNDYMKIKNDDTNYGGLLKRWVKTHKKPLCGLSAIEGKEKIYLMYQPVNASKGTFHIAESNDGFNFNLLKKSVINDDLSCFEDLNGSHINDQYIAIYRKKENNTEKTYISSSKDMYSLGHAVETTSLKEPGVIVPDYQFRDHYLMYSGGPSLSLSASKDLKEWKQIVQSAFSPEENVAYGIEYVMVSDTGIHVYYHTKKTINKISYFYIGVVIFDKESPQHIIWRTHDPIWEQPELWHGKRAHPLGAAVLDHKLFGYWHIEGEGIYAVVYTIFKDDGRFSTKNLTVKLNKPNTNPILSPNPENSWEAFNTFNPAAIYENGKVHIIYRAQGFDYVSVLGYATSTDGVTIDERFKEPAYLPSEQFEYTGTVKPKKIAHMYMSGGGYGGCEDPRITKINDRFYMTYVAYDGCNPPRIALTSIAVEDFLNRKWLWEKPVLISPPGVVNKNAVIFPEKINGKYVIIHRIYPNMLIDYVDNLEFDGESQWLEGHYKISPRKNMWDSKKIGAGAPPIKTKKGWLLIYQSVGYQDSGKYKIGAMLLDLNDPTKVLHRSNKPILEPDEKYENEGFKAGVAYPCGAVVIDDTLFVYYGGADSVVCVATAQLNSFLDELTKFEVATLDPAVIRKIM